MNGPISKTRTRKRIFLVDDHPVLRHGIAGLLRAEPDLDICGEASTTAEAYAMIGPANPDLVVTDISMDGNNGLELMKELTFRWPKIVILAYSMHDEAVYGERALRAGAKGYVSKHAPIEDLIKAVRMLLDGKVYLSETLSNRMLGNLVGTVRTSKARPQAIETLSDRELEVLHATGEGLSTSEIAAKLCLSVKTIETYRQHLKRKLNIPTGRQLAKFAVEWNMAQGRTNSAGDSASGS